MPKILTEEEKLQRAERARASKREYARRKREEKKVINVTDNFFGGFKLSLDNSEIDKPADIQNPGSLKTETNATEGPSITPFDESVFGNIKDKLLGLKKMLVPESVQVGETSETNEKNDTQSVPANTQKQNSGEKQKLIDEYITIITSGVDPDKIDVSDNLKKLVRNLEESDISDLRIRVTLARKHLYKGVDTQISEKTLDLACLVAGKALKCYDELHEDVMKDEYLKNLTSTMLTNKVLHMIPDHLKIGGLFASHVLKAKLASTLKEQPITEVITNTTSEIVTPMQVIQPVTEEKKNTPLIPNVKIPAHLMPLKR
jgi:hypothetical protein